jgi:hypothetical protein
MVLTGSGTEASGVGSPRQLNRDERRRTTRDGPEPFIAVVRGVGPLLALLIASAHARASETAPPRLPEADAARPVPRVEANSETILRFYQRSLQPGPLGALVHRDTVVPAYEYWSLRASNIGTPLSSEPANLELSGWFSTVLGERQYESAFTGDINAAWFRQPLGALTVTLGRQALYGGAARYARFDGGSVSFSTSSLGAGQRGPWTFAVEGYGGYTVMPKWDQRPGYFHLGSATDNLVKQSDGLPDAQRSGNVLWGFRSRVTHTTRFVGGLSFHEQRDGGQVRQRNLGLDVRYVPVKQLSFSGNAIADTDSRALRDGRLWLDIEPDERWLASVEYLHTNPALFLSRQSVLGVFGAEEFDELGGELAFRPSGQLSSAAFGYVEWFGQDRLGTRSGAWLTIAPDRAHTTQLRLGYTRVMVASDGYHSLRNSLRQRVLPRLTGVIEAYLYWYDRPVVERHSSSVYAANLQWAWSPRLRVLWGASLAETPYAASDLQSLVRLSYSGMFQSSSQSRQNANRRPQ